MSKQLDQLWKEYGETKSKIAKDKLLVEYASLVKYTAERLAFSLPKSVELDDLIGAGIMGLIKAVESFDPSREVKFETFATHRIRGSILDELRALDWVPRSIRQKSKMLERAYQALEKKLGRAAYDDEVADFLNISGEELDQMLIHVTPVTVIGFDDPLPTDDMGDSKSVKVVEVIEDPKGSTPLKDIEYMETKKILKESILELPEKEKLVIALYHYEELTLKEIGEVLGISESRVSQIHSKAIIKLKSKLSKKINM